MKSVLLTAFEPFAGESVNPSLEVAREMKRLAFDGASIRTVELPVDRYRAIDVALAQIRSDRPDVIIMLGEGSRRYKVNFERVAINVDDFRIPDNTGNQPRGEPIVEGGPVGYFSTLPIRAITERLIEAHIPAAISNSAGVYLCNRLFYGVMHFVSVERLPTRAGFIHLPYLHEQVADKHPDAPSLSRESMTEAVRLAIEVSIAELE